jgi:DNA-binding transcriptional LysR family regulator
MQSSEFAELRAFVAVAERNDFARCAAQLGLVPSTMSQTIKP